MRFIKKLCAWGLAVWVLLSSSAASAHVKWFSNFSFDDTPKTLPNIMDGVFWGLLAVSVVAIALMVIIDYKVHPNRWSRRLTIWLERHRGYSAIIMRAASAAVLLLSFQSGALFVPELRNGTEALGWVQFALALMLLFPRVVFIVGIGIIGLYLYGVGHYGWFHMLDYAIFVGVGYYLIVHSVENKQIRGTGLIILYVTLGFSLAWLGIEKLVYPQWGLYVLEQNPHLALGINMSFFLTAAAFVEISLGYLMMICLLQRPVALIVTLVFFTTTIIFGKTEVIGHTILHAALIVFLLEGPGKVYPTPVEWHRTLWLRIAFACVNFIVVLFALLWPYQKTAMTKHMVIAEKIRSESAVEIKNPRLAPQIQLDLLTDDASGYALHIKTLNFTFAPENTGKMHVTGEGHAHVYVDNHKAGRAYGPWFYIPPLTKGPHEIKVTLNTNDHRLFLVNGKPVEAVLKFNVSDKDNEHAHH